MKPVRLQFETGQRSVAEWLLGDRGSLADLIGAATLAGAIATIVATGWQLTATRQDLAAMQAELQALGRQQPVAVAASTKPAVSAEERRAWNQVVRQLNTPWAALLDALETATPEDVALVSVEPDARQSSVRLQVEAKSLDALLSHAQALKATEPFAEVTPLKHETNEQDPNRPVRLTLNLRLREARSLEAATGDAR